MSDSPSARRILDTAMQTRAQTPDEAYADLARLLREPSDGTGPRIGQEVPFVRKVQGRPARRLMNPYRIPPLSLAIVALLLIAAQVARWIGWIG